MVESRQRLSLPKHVHRSEHWVQVKVIGKVTLDDKVSLPQQSVSTYMTAGIKHRLCNPGMAPLEPVESTSGRYLGEDDIVRFEDGYGPTSEPNRPK